MFPAGFKCENNEFFAAVKATVIRRTLLMNLLDGIRKQWQYP